MKTLLDNLEDQIPPEDPDMPPQMLAEQNEEAEAEQQNWPQEADGIQRDRGLVPRDPVSAERAVSLLRTKLQAMLSTPRSTRRSGCFGGRIDRIGSHTGLGCNSFRVRRLGIRLGQGLGFSSA